ncbi:MAG: porin family protein [Flavisolibacter sp.]
MKKVMLYIFLSAPLFALSQFGLKAGVNFANVTNASSINSSSQSGFMVGAFLAPASKGLLSSRTEIVYSRQGYNFSTSTKSGNVNLDYLLIPQLMGINLTKLLQLQVGFQMAFLLNATADSLNSSGTSSPYGSVMDYYNKFDYGFALGAEVHPFKGLLIGARYNISLGKLYKDLGTGTPPSFTAQDAKNNVVQLFAGWRFGK